MGGQEAIFSVRALRDEVRYAEYDKRGRRRKTSEPALRAVAAAAAFA